MSTQSRPAARRDWAPPRGAAKELSVGVVTQSRPAARRDWAPPRGAAKELSVGVVTSSGALAAEILDPEAQREQRREVHGDAADHQQC